MKKEIKNNINDKLINNKLIKKIFFSKKKNHKELKTIILSEAEDKRVQEAALIIEKLGIAKLILLTKKDINFKGKSLVINTKKISTFFDEQLLELRKDKIKNIYEARKKLKDNNYFANMMLINNMADSIVGGNISKTKDFLRPALELLKKNNKRLKKPFAYSYFLMLNPENKGKEIFFVADCALNINPTSKELSVIAEGVIEDAKKIIKPKIAFLSYSTKGSGKGNSVEKVKKAYLLTKKKIKDVEGELQFDAAINKEAGKRKGLNCKNGCFNVLIFPELNSGNIGYKIMNTLGNYLSIGPIILGLEKKISDLSRSCSVEEIVLTIALLAK